MLIWFSREFGPCTLLTCTHHRCVVRYRRMVRKMRNEGATDDTHRASVSLIQIGDLSDWLQESRLRVCASLLAPSSIDNWKVKLGRWLSVLNYKVRIQQPWNFGRTNSFLKLLNPNNNKWRTATNDKRQVTNNKRKAMTIKDK